MLDFFLQYLLVYKYSVLSSVIVLASFGFPAPATALIMAAGAFAAQGYFDAYGVMICAFFSSISGDIFGYTMARKFGREFLYRLGLRKILQSWKFLAIEGMFTQHSGSTLFLSRFLTTGVGPLVNVLAGLSKMPLKRFLGYGILGELVYAVLFSVLGYVFGDQWEVISSLSENIAIVLLLLLVLIIAVVIIFRKRKKQPA